MRRARRVVLTAIRWAPCAVCGRRARRSTVVKVFWGFSRTREQAQKTADAQIAAWYAKPHRHEGCEPEELVGCIVDGEHSALAVRRGGLVTRKDGFARRR